MDGPIHCAGTQRPETVQAMDFQTEENYAGNDTSCSERRQTFFGRFPQFRLYLMSQVRGECGRI
jgi:hypothetical protein